MLIKDLIKTLSKLDDTLPVMVYVDGEPIEIVDIDTGISDRVDLVIGDYVIDNRVEDLNQRVEELEGQNAFECECVKERDSKLQAIKKLVASISPYAIPKDVAVKLFDVLCIVDK